MVLNMNNNVEVLVAATNKSDTSFLDNLGLFDNCIVANQADSLSVDKDSDRNIIIITTDQRGVGKNRNLALGLSDKEYLLFADDDNLINHEYKKVINNAFIRYPNADIVVFNVKIENPRIKVKKHKDGKKITLLNYAKYGACQIAIKRSSWIKKPVFFSELFGGGALYSSGEDALFLRECIRKKYNIIASDQSIVEVIQKQSSWFKGYNRKFFFDEGALVAAMFPWLKYITMFYFCLRFGKYTSVPFTIRLKLMYQGIKDYDIGKGYEPSDEEL